MHPLVSHLIDFFQSETEAENRALRLGVAVSGGVDSMSLLVALHKASQLMSCVNVARVVHVHHGLRDTADRDQVEVLKLSHTLNIPVSLLRVSDAPQSNIESWARDVRYDFFSSTAHSCDLDYIVTAHHQDDELETFVFRLCSGRLNNLSELIFKKDVQRKILRPLLKLPKSVLNDYAVENSVPYCFDESNASKQFLRNRVRSEILPVIEKIFPTYRSSLSASMNYVNTLAQLTRSKGIALSREKLSIILSAHHEHAIEAFREMLRKDCPHGCELVSRVNILRFIELLKETSSGSGSYDLGHGVLAYWSGLFSDSGIVRFNEGVSRLEIQERLERLEHWNSPLLLGEDVEIPATRENLYLSVRLDASMEEKSRELKGDNNSRKICVSLPCLSQEELSTLRIGRSCPFERMDVGDQKPRRVSKILKEGRRKGIVPDDVLYIWSAERLICIPGYASIPSKSSTSSGEGFSIMLEKSIKN